MDTPAGRLIPVRRLREPAVTPTDAAVTSLPTNEAGDRAAVADRVVVLRTRDPLGFVADVCAALADAVNEIRVSSVGERELEATYAEMVVAYSRLLRPAAAEAGSGVARAAVIDHLVERLRQAALRRECLNPRDRRPAARRVGERASAGLTS